MTAEVEGELRFYVTSEKEPGERYLVDLGEYKGNGACSCWNFAMTCKPSLEGRERPGPMETRFRCKHIIYVQSLYGASIIYEKLKG